MIYTYDKVPEDVKKDIDYIYLYVINNGGKRSLNYTPERLAEPVLATTIRYDIDGNPVCTSRILVRESYENAVRVLDRYALIEKQQGLLPHNYDGKFKPETSLMLEQQTDFCHNLGFDCIFFSLDKKKAKTMSRVITGHNQYSKYQWSVDGPVYVTNKKTEGGYQVIGYTGSKFRRRDDGIYNANME